MALLLLLLIFSSPLLLSCSAEEAGVSLELQKHSYSEGHLGTSVHLVFYATNEANALQLSQRCFIRVRELDEVFSDYRSDSEVSELCSKPIGIAYKVSDELFTVIDYAQSVSKKSGGAFDITLGKHTKRWRQKSQYSEHGDETSTAKEKELPVSYEDIILDPIQKSILLKKPLSIDLGGIAKGYIADQLMLILRRAGMNHAAVIIGGETVLAAAPPGKKGWSMGVENPECEIIGKLTLVHTALSTSGDSYQFFEENGKRKSHLIDPKNKQSKVNRLNVLTIARSAMEADCWATALRVSASDEAFQLASKEPKLEALFIPHLKGVLSTAKFPQWEKFQKVK